MRIMVENPQLECLPEHKGPALNTWQIIMQTAMEKCLQHSPPLDLHVENEVNMKKLSISQTDNKVIPGKGGQDASSKARDDGGVDADEKGSNRRKSVTSDCSVESEELPCKVGYAPWNKSFNRGYPESTYGLHLEIMDFYRYISPLPEEEVMRQDLVQRMKELITRILPGAKVEVFGSFETCLYLPSSDIDLAVFGEWDKLPLFALKEGLISSGVAEPNSVMVLDKASVPIVKLRDKASKVRVDISFNTDASVKSVMMIKSYLKKFPHLPYIFLTLKHFLVQRDLNEVFTGGISSYCLLLLTVSFFQFQEKSPHKNKQQQTDLGVMLMEFLELYGRNLNYQRIGIKIKDGGSYVNKDKLTTDLAVGEYPALLCIEDPVTLATDIGKSSYGILRVKEAFECGFNDIDKALRLPWYFKINPNSTYLSRVISVTQELYDYRKWVQKTYHNMVSIPRTLLPPNTATVFHPNVAAQVPNDGKPPLLPTPTIYSPTLQLSTPPFSPFTTVTTNGIMFNQVGFIPNSKVITHQQLQQQVQQSQQQLQQQHNTTQQPQVLPQQIMMGNISSMPPTCIQNKENLSNVLAQGMPLNQLNSSYLTNSVPCLPPIGYVLPPLVTTTAQQQVEQLSHRQSSSYSVMKAKNNYNDKSHGNHGNNIANHGNHGSHSNQGSPRLQDNHHGKNRSNDNTVYNRSYSPKNMSKNNSRNFNDRSSPRNFSENSSRNFNDRSSPRNFNDNTASRNFSNENFRNYNGSCIAEDSTVSDHFNDTSHNKYSRSNSDFKSKEHHYADRKRVTNERSVNSVEDVPVMSQPRESYRNKVVGNSSSSNNNNNNNSSNNNNNSKYYSSVVRDSSSKNTPVECFSGKKASNEECFTSEKKKGSSSNVRSTPPMSNSPVLIHVDDDSSQNSSRNSPCADMDAIEVISISSGSSCGSNDD